MAAFEKIVTSEGHLIDSGLMRQIFDTVISDGGEFQILDFEIGKTNQEPSKANLKIMAGDAASMNKILLKLSSLGCVIDQES